MSDVKLYNKDCLDVLSAIPAGSVDCVICDLPYFGVVKNDFDNQWKTRDEYLGWVHELICEYNRVLKDGSNLFLFTSRQYNRHICMILDKFFVEKRIIIWCRKRGFNTTRGNALSSGYEPICYYSKGSGAVFNSIKIKPDTDRKEYTEGFLRGGVNLSDVWTDISALPHNAKEKTSHPTQKPVALMKRLVFLGTNPGDVVLDSCMGSGSTGVACVEENRRFIGIETVPEYFEIARKRIEKANQKLF
jgi:site-specific DNA-methyltransferase (adenine-specific)